jgi:DNA-binding MarR family transcriptional regulator
MTAIASSSDGLVCLSDLARDLNVTASNLQKPLRDLVRAGLVSRLPSGDSKRKFYARNDSLAWAFALEIAATAERLSLSEQLP